MQFETYSFEKIIEQNSITVTQKRSDINFQDMARVKMLELAHPQLLPAKLSWDEDRVIYQFDKPSLSLTWEELAKRSVSERLRVLLNCVKMESLLSLDLTFFLEPENIFLDVSGNPQLLYRGLKKLQAPFEMTADILLRQLKSLIISHFSDQDFNSLYNGGLEVVSKDTPFIQKVKELGSIEELRELLLADYKEAAEKEAASMQSVPKTRFKLYRSLTLIFGILAFLFVIPLAYYAFIREPFNATMLEADEAYLKVDYSGVVEALENVPVEDIPKAQKYILTTAYVNLLDMDKNRRQYILNNVSLIADEMYLDYWIYNGRGDYDQSLDLGKRMENYDLIIYALSNKLTQVRNDNEMDGETREKEMSSLEESLKKYKEARQEILTPSSSGELPAAGESESKTETSASQ